MHSLLWTRSCRSISIYIYIVNWCLLNQVIMFLDLPNALVIRLINMVNSSRNSLLSHPSATPQISVPRVSYPSRQPPQGHVETFPGVGVCWWLLVIENRHLTNLLGGRGYPLVKYEKGRSDFQLFVPNGLPSLPHTLAASCIAPPCPTHACF